jgi:hypothetical protein
MSNNKNETNYQQLSNRPIACTFCGAEVRGQVRESVNPSTKQTEKICKWNCSRCGNLVRIGRI